MIDYLVRQGRTFAGAGAFDEVSARADAEAEVARTTDVQCATTNIGFADHGPGWRERLGEITAPTLVLHGEDDPFFPIGNGEAFAAEIPDARLVRLGRVGAPAPCSRSTGRREGAHRTHRGLTGQPANHDRLVRQSIPLGVLRRLVAEHNRS